MSSSQNPNPFQNLSAHDQSLIDMLNLLVKSVTGYSIDELPQDKAKEIVKLCIDYFTTWIENYVAQNYGKKDLIRIKVAHSSDKGIEVFSKFSELGDKFDSAWNAFFEEMENKWEAELEKTDEN